MTTTAPLADPKGTAPATPDTGKNDGGQQIAADASKTTPDAGASQGFDPSKLSDDEFGKTFDDPRLFNHPRFKELNERAKKAQQLEQAQNEAEQKRLQEQGKFQELAQKTGEENRTLKERLKTQAQNQSLMIEAQKAGITDLDAALKLVDRSGISVDDNDVVTGTADAIKALVAGKPYLVGAKTPVKVGSPSNPANPTNPNNQAPTLQTADGKRIFKLSEIQDVQFYRKNHKEIKLAVREGRTVNDLGGQVGAAGGQ